MNKRDIIYQALVEECRQCLDKVKGTEREAWLKILSENDRTLMQSFGPFTKSVAERAGISSATVSYHLSKDGRVESENPGAGTCRRWWAKGVK